MNFNMIKMVQQLRFYQQCVKKVILRVICLYFGSMSQIINDQNIYMLNASNKTWIIENDIFEEYFQITSGGNQYRFGFEL